MELGTAPTAHGLALWHSGHFGTLAPSHPHILTPSHPTRTLATLGKRYGCFMVAVIQFAQPPAAKGETTLPPCSNALRSIDPALDMSIQLDHRGTKPNVREASLHASTARS
jgi:hypothetical protein